MTRRLLAALVAVLLGTATGAVVLAAPAQAAACAKGDGVTVVVDYHQLGGGASTTCVPGGGRKATSAFDAAGVSLRYAARQQGFVCQVNAKPANAGCVQASPSDAYWSLWVSSGNGSWSYATAGVGGVSVPKGGWVAWSWQGQSGRAQPGVSPVGKAAAAPAPKPSSRPTQKAPTAAPTSAVPSAEASASAKAKAKEKAQAEKKAEQKAEEEREASAASPSDGAGDDGTTSDDETRATSADAGSPWPTLVGVAAVLVLLGAAGVVAWRRRGSAP
ncbi:LPXTG cell wall anchor domain-containing protein [Aeromicrobium sp. Leaf291]|uniref:LPXTG cell wall anchor domain-containing protein n=1 Tax=Aeromicrobium sp. Leaf291 TaxID=1736325 RepID=UPI000701AE2D|nr:LPXTG cell wall anchor domain-containing protein [Aeromicrobium sp. Leaf291]KQP84078.1 hypothetical protein ASF35_03820 [Aeromicrobium sp. Leaf291]